jgi:hypothetical protein
MPFEQVSLEDFDRAVANARSTAAFKRQIARFAPTRDQHCFVHRDPLLEAGHFRAPGYCTLIIGDLDVAGLVDLNNPDGFDEGGVFAVIGNVTCRGFANHFGKCTFIDGDLIASDIIINSYGDSSLVVTGNLKTRFYYGLDIWAEVGGEAAMEYGRGYCLPLGYTDAATQGMRPAHNLEQSMAQLALAEPANGYFEGELVKALKQGRTIFK